MTDSTPSTASATSPARLTFAQCVDLAKSHPRGETLIQLLRAQRVFRVVLWAPPKRGKTTLLMGAMKWLQGDGIIWSIDGDVSPWDRIIPVLLPLPATRGELPALKSALEIAFADAQSALINGECSLVAVDTLTTMYAHFTWMSNFVAADLGFGTTQQAAMQAVAPQARVVVGMGVHLFNLRGAAILSPLDCPIVLAATEHAASVTYSKAVGNPHDKNDPYRMDFRHHHWAPKIGAETGNSLYGQTDIQLGLSLGHPDDPPDYVATLSAGFAGNRFTEKEAQLFASVMTGTARDRFGKALRVVWEHRKVAWATNYKLLP